MTSLSDDLSVKTQSGGLILSKDLRDEGVKNPDLDVARLSDKSPGIEIEMPWVQTSTDSGISIVNTACNTNLLYDYYVNGGP